MSFASPPAQGVLDRNPPMKRLFRPKPKENQILAIILREPGCFKHIGNRFETARLFRKYCQHFVRQPGCFKHIANLFETQPCEAPGVFGTQRLPRRICTLSHCPWVARFKEYPRGFFAYPYAPGPNFVKLLSRKYCSENPMLSQKGWGTVPTTVWTDFRLVTSFC